MKLINGFGIGGRRRFPWSLLFVLLACSLIFASCAARPANVPPGETKAPAVLEHTPLPAPSPSVPADTAGPSQEATVCPSLPAGETAAPPSETPCVSSPSPGPTSDMNTDIPSVAPSAAPSVAPSTPGQSPDQAEAVFLGVKGYGHISAAAVSAPGARVYRFLVDGEERLYSIRNTGGFPIQNRLMERYRYRIGLDGSEVISAELISAPAGCLPPVSGVPGLRTLKNFLTTALEPIGTALYVYGGGWDWQDEGSSIQSRTIGISGSWVDFFNRCDAGYCYKDGDHPESSTYPFGGWNEYYYAGLDCSGYLGWTLYNTLETQSGRSGYVSKSSGLAKKLANTYRLGSFHTEKFELGAGDFMPGDVVSMSGHVYIVLGRCSDGSIVILHSTVSSSVTGARGGGVQMGVLDPHSGGNCEAYALAERYTREFFPGWLARYPISIKSFDQYVGFDRTGNTGVFRWSIGSGGLSDPEGVRDMSAAEILALIFGR